MNKTILECNGIAAGYVKGLNILQGVDLVVHEGEIVSIIGPNGAGKSTLLKAIMSLIKVSAGRFYINGIEKTNLSTHKIVTEGIGYVPQVANVFPSLTIEENLEIGSWIIKDKRNAIKKIYSDFSKDFRIPFQYGVLKKSSLPRFMALTSAPWRASLSTHAHSLALVLARTPVKKANVSLPMRAKGLLSAENG